MDINLLQGQSDPDGDTLSASNISVTGPTLGAIAFTTNGNTISIDPSGLNLAKGVQELVTVSYQLSDGTATTPNTAIFTVTGGNTGPTANTVAASAPEGTVTGDDFTINEPSNGTVPNAGTFIVVDTNAQTVSQVLKASVGSDINNIPLQNGAIIEVNPNNDDWGMSGFVYTNGTPSAITPASYTLTGYTGGQTTSGTAVSFSDATTGATLEVTLPNVPTNNGTSDLKVDLKGINFADTAPGDLTFTSVNAVSTKQASGTNLLITANTSDPDAGDTLSYTINTTGTQGTVATTTTEPSPTIPMAGLRASRQAKPRRTPSNTPPRIPPVPRPQRP